ncbi:MAG: GDP-mannose 4,6-dehydratase [Candidatus Diapherotrites archaeon]
MAENSAKTAVVTGGAGFIGANLCEFLLQKKINVICVDNFLTGSKENVAHLLSDKNFSLVSADISKEIPVKEKVDFVFNLASPASPIHYQEHPIETLLVGSLGTKNALELALKNNASFLQASTSEVYGEPLEHPQKETYWGNVNPVGVRSCFSEDTEVLTLDGWKLFCELNKNDFILTLTSGGLIEYSHPLEIIKQQYVGQMFEFKNSKIDLLVTPNHKMYVKPRDRRFTLIEAFESIQWHRAEMQKGARWDGQENSYFYLKRVKNAKSEQQTKIEMDTWLEFLGYFLTEGSTHERKRQQSIGGKIYHTKAYNVLISQSKKKKEYREKIKACLGRLGFKFYEENAQFRIVSKQLFSYLRQFGKSKERFIPTEMKQLSKRQLTILFDALMLGDGSVNKGAFYSSSDRLVGDFQEILLKLGFAGTIVFKDKRKNRPVYQLHVLSNKRKDFLTPLYPKRKVIDYNGFVWCVNVPNHVIYVRRNGKAVFSGNCYDEAKRFSEALVMAYRRAHKANTHIVRIFNTYGPRMAVNDGRVVPNFIVQALKGEPLTIYGDGKQTRSFCFVSDLVEGLFLAINSDYHEPINIGNPNEFSMLEFAEKVVALTGAKSKISFKPLPKDDPSKRRPDISLAKKLLKWGPRVSLEDGLEKTVAYFREVL